MLHLYLDENDITPDKREELIPNGFTHASLKVWYLRVGKFGNKVFNDIAAEINQFRAQLRGIVDKEFFLFRLAQIYA